MVDALEVAVGVLRGTEVELVVEVQSGTLVLGWSLASLALKEYVEQLLPPGVRLLSLPDVHALCLWLQSEVLLHLRRRYLSDAALKLLRLV